MNSAPIILLVLVGLVLVFGVGVVVYNRRKAAPQQSLEVLAPVAPRNRSSAAIRSCGWGL